MIFVRDEATGAEHDCPTGARVVLGRPAPDGRVDIACDNKHVSRKHCELFAKPDGTLAIVDSSAYGTFVNGTRIVKEGLARAGDRVVLGHDYVLTIHERPTQFEPTRMEAPTIAQPSGEFGQHPSAVGAPPAPEADEALTLARPPGMTPLPGEPAPVGAVALPIEAATIPPLRTNAPLTEIGARYKIKRELGRGGMGIVYEAFDDLRQRACAVKRLLSVGKTPPGFIERFKREAMLGARLGEHPGIVAIFDLGVIAETGELYCAMDFVDGTSLSELLRSEIDRKKAMDLVVQVARAVEYAHSKSVIHRDLKPENVIVTKDGVARLTDFGISKALDEGQGLTATGTVMGTPSYMAPEQLADAKRAGPSADIYALGGILYFALTRWPPYTGRSLREVLKQVSKGELVPPRERDASVPKKLDELCRRTLATDPAARPKTAAAFADELSKIKL